MRALPDIPKNRRSQSGFYFRAAQDTKDVTAVALSSDGKSLAASDANGGVFIWNITTRRLITGLHGPNKQPVWDVAFNPDDMTVADCTSANKSYNNGSV
jgi:WD40 repeat protein